MLQRDSHHNHVAAAADSLSSSSPPSLHTYHKEVKILVVSLSNTVGGKGAVVVHSVYAALAR